MGATGSKPYPLRVEKDFDSHVFYEGIKAMHRGKNRPFIAKLDVTICQNIGRNYSKSSSSGMDFAPDETTPRGSLILIDQIAHSITSFRSLDLQNSHGAKKRFAESEMRCSTAKQKNLQASSSISTKSTSQMRPDYHCPILPGLPDDVAKLCLALVPRRNFPIMGSVCKRWRSFIQSKEFTTIRKEVGRLEELLYVLTHDTKGKGSHWEVLGGLGEEHQLLPSMPGAKKAAFGVVVLDGKLLVMAGYMADVGASCVSADVYQYDSRLNRWSILAKMNVARYDFACAEVNNMVYAVGGYGADGESLTSAEVYDPEKNEWTLIGSLRRPRWGCFACGFEGKLYVMGGRSSFTIGNSRFVDVYNPENHTWCEMKNGCVMVTAHAVLGKKLFCMEWKNQRKLAIFNPIDNSWKMIAVPLTGSSRTVFRFGVLNGKLLLFSLKEEPGYHTLLYDPDAAPGLEWKTSAIKPYGLCLCSVTIKA